MKTTPKTFHLSDIWEQYAATLLAANPEWWGIIKNGVQNHTLYRKYTDDNGRKIIIMTFCYDKFRKIITTYFKLAQDTIIQGNALDMTSGVGKMCMRRVQRNHAHKSINFYKTKMQPKVWSPEHGKEVRKKIIYYVSDDWSRVGWHKFGKMKNETVYEFVITTNSKSGNCFRQKIHKALNNDPLLKYKYIYFPLIK